MPAPHPAEFRQRAVALARAKERPIAVIAKGLGISESCLRNWVAQADADEGKSDAMSTAERKQLAELRKENRRLELENEILRQAAAYFARENVLPKWCSRWWRPWLTRVCPRRSCAACWACPPPGTTTGAAGRFRHVSEATSHSLR